MYVYRINISIWYYWAAGEPPELFPSVLALAPNCTAALHCRAFDGPVAAVGPSLPIGRKAPQLAAGRP